jgi:hypothetical protein
VFKSTQVPGRNIYFSGNNVICQSFKLLFQTSRPRHTNNTMLFLSKVKLLNQWHTGKSAWNINRKDHSDPHLIFLWGVDLNSKLGEILNLMLRLLTGGSSTLYGRWGKFLSREMLNGVSVQCRNLWCKTWSYTSMQFKIYQSFVLRITFFNFDLYYFED